MQTLALTVAGVLYASGASAAVGPSLGGCEFKSWEEAGEVSLARAHGKCCLVVAECKPHDVYLFGTIEFDHPKQDELIATDPHLHKVGAKGYIVDGAVGSKMSSLLDNEGNVYVLFRSEFFEHVPNISAVAIAQGILSLAYLDRVTKTVKMYSGTGLPSAVEGFFICLLSFLLVFFFFFLDY